MSGVLWIGPEFVYDIGDNAHVTLGSGAASLTATRTAHATTETTHSAMEAAHATAEATKATECAVAGRFP